MKKTFLIIAIFYCIQAQAQQNTNQFSAQVGVTASTTAAYKINGVDTSLQNAFTLAPSIRLMHESGLGVAYSINSLVSGYNKKLFMQTLTAFYEEYEKPLNLNIAFSHFFFSNNAAIPYTPITTELYAFLAYKKLWLAPAFATSIGFGKNENNKTETSINIAPGVTHSFSFSNKNNMETDITPSIFLNGSSSKVYSFLKTSQYINQNTGSKSYLKKQGRKRRNGTTVPVSTAATTASNKFAFNNVELALYSSFKLGHFEIVPDGSLFVPLNADNGFSAYWQLKLAYNIGR